MRLEKKHRQTQEVKDRSRVTHSACAGIDGRCKESISLGRACGRCEDVTMDNISEGKGTGNGARAVIKEGHSKGEFAADVVASSRAACGMRLLAARGGQPAHVHCLARTPAISSLAGSS